jgi:hypothetical protein
MNENQDEPERRNAAWTQGKTPGVYTGVEELITSVDQLSIVIDNIKTVSRDTKNGVIATITLSSFAIVLSIVSILLQLR